MKETLVQERDRLYNLLKEVPFPNPYPCYSNFILCEVASGMDAKALKVCFSRLHQEYTLLDDFWFCIQYLHCIDSDSQTYTCLCVYS